MVWDLLFGIGRNGIRADVKNGTRDPLHMTLELMIRVTKVLLDSLSCICVDCSMTSRFKGRLLLSSDD